MAKETRLPFVPPPLPKADPQDIAMWARRFTVLLSTYLNQLQQVLLESQAQLYDVNVPVPSDENLVDAETQFATTDSAGLL
jgi:hypothetical protein